METLAPERRRHASSRPPGPAAASLSRAHGTRDRVLAAVALSAIGIGTGVRLWLLLGGRGAITGDEAVVGLMARHVVAHGQVDAFFWGQHYGGTLEVLLTAPFVALFGTTAFALRIVPLTLFAASCAVTYVIARRALPRGAAACAAALMWVWPANLVWHTSREWGFYGAALLLGVAMIELTLRAVDRPDGWRPWIALAAVAGLAWWTSPQALHFAIPAAAWLVIQVRRHLWRLVVVAPVAVLASAPWLVHNVRTGWASLQPPTNTVSDGFVGNIGTFFTRALPVTFGLEIDRHPVVPLAGAIAWALVAVVALALWRRRRALGLVAVVLVAYPLVYAVFPLAAAVGEGRYTVFALPFLAILLVVGAARPPLQALFVGAAVVLTLATASSVAPNGSPYSPDAREPAAIGPLLHALDRAGIDRVRAAYHTAYRIDFHSDERIVAAANTDARWRPYQRILDAAARPAWVFPRDSRQAAAFRGGLDARHVAYDTFAAGGYVVYWPESPRGESNS